MKNIKLLLAAAIVTMVGLTASLQTKASLSFNGTNTKAVLDGYYLDGTTHSNYTFEVWIKPYTLGGEIFGKSLYWKEWTLDTASDGGLMFRGAWPSYYWGTETAQGSITTNIWQHVCCAVTDGQASFYVNGTFVGTEVVQNPIDFASQMGGTLDGPMNIGYADSGTTPDYNFFNGLIYGIKVWSRTLSASEVSAIVTTGVPPSTNGLYNAVMLDEVSGSTLEDSRTDLTGRVLTALRSSDTPPMSQADLSFTNSTPIASYFIDLSHNNNYRTPILSSQSNYCFRATGRGGVGPLDRGDAMADAAFYPSFHPLTAKWAAPANTWTWVERMPFRPTPDVFNPNHVYYFYFQGRDTYEELLFQDSPYSDNVGGFNVDLFLVSPQAPQDPAFVWTKLPGSTNLPPGWRSLPGSMDENHRIIYSLSENGVFWKYDIGSNLFTQLPVSGAWPGRVDTFIYNPEENSIWFTLYGRGQVFRLPVTGGAFASVGASGASYSDFSDITFWNPVTHKFATFSGYGFGAVRNWRWEFGTTNSDWVEIEPNIPGRQPWCRQGGSWTVDNIAQRVFVGAGIGNSSGNQGQVDPGFDIWADNRFDYLRDLWLLDLKSNKWVNLIPLNTATRHYGTLVYFPPQEMLLMINGRDTTPDASFVNGVWTFVVGRATNFTKATISGTIPNASDDPNGLSLPYYDSLSQRVIYFNTNGVYALSHISPSPAPIITTQPVSQSVNQGSAVSFNVIATGTGLNFQWRLNSVNISAATNASYNLASATTNDAGIYNVIVSNAVGSVTSSNAVLTVIQSTPPDNFLTNGLVAYYPFNGNANDASGNGHNGTNHGGVLVPDRFGNPNQAYYFNGSAAYITAPFSSSVFNGDYTVSTWFNAYDFTNAWPDLLNQQYDGFTLGIVGQLSGIPPYQFGRLFAYSANGPGGPFIYGTLYMNRPNTPTNIFCQAVITKTATNVTMYFNGQYATNGPVDDLTTPPGQYLTIGRGDVAVQPAYTAFHGVIDDIRIYNRALSSNEVTQLYVYESTPVIHPPSITTHPVSQSVNQGSPVSFGVTATGTNLNFQWRLNSVNISGATNDTYNLASATTSDAGIYNVVVSNLGGSVTSSNAVLTVIEPPRTATGTATLVSGFVVSVIITDGGSGYTNTPLVRLIGGGGSGAQAVAVVSNGVVTAIIVLDAGYGYTSAPLVFIEPPFIPSPVLSIAPMSFLAFSNLTVGGVYQLQRSVAWYWSNQPVSFTATNDVYTQMVGGVAGSADYRLALNPVPAQAFATPVVYYGFVVGATVTSGGSGYVTTPAVSIVGGGGTNAAAVATLSGGVVTSISITDAGIGYTNTPTIRIESPPAAAVSPTVLPVVRVDSTNLVPYSSYQIQFKPALDGAWENWNGGLFTPTDVTNSEYLFITNGAGFFRLHYAP